MSNGVFRQSFPAADLSLERGTDAVPSDGLFHLLVSGRIVKSFRSAKAARAEYQKLRRAYLDQHPVQRSAVDVHDVLRDDFNRLSNKELIWTPEDFERIERMTRRRR